MPIVVGALARLARRAGPSRGTRFALLVALAVLHGCCAAAPEPPPEADLGPPWISLFNGENLDGWNTIGSAVWRVEDGVIVGGQDGDPRKSGLLATERQFQDFELRLDFMIDEHGKYNSGVYLRNDPGTGRRRGYQVNLGRGAAGEPVGLFLNDWLDKGDEHDQVRRPLQWNTLRIVARGPHIVVDLNGVNIVDYVDPDPKPHLLEPGVIAFQTYGAEGHAGWVKLRDVRVRELNPLPEGEVVQPSVQP